MFPIRNALEIQNSKKNAIWIGVLCGPNGLNGRNVLLVVEEGDVKEAVNVPHRLSEMDDTSVKGEMTLKSKLAMKM